MPIPARGFTSEEQTFEVVKTDTMSLGSTAQERTHQTQQSGRCDPPGTLGPDVPRSIPHTSSSLDTSRYHSEHDPFHSSVKFTFTNSARAQDHRMLLPSQNKASKAELKSNLSGRSATPMDEMPSSSKTAVMAETSVKGSADGGIPDGKDVYAVGDDIEAHGADPENTAPEDIRYGGEATAKGQACNRSLLSATKDHNLSDTHGSPQSCHNADHTDDLQFAAEFARLALIQCTPKATPTEQNQAEASESTSGHVSTQSDPATSFYSPTRNRPQHAKRSGGPEDDDSEDDRNSSGRNNEYTREKAEASTRSKTFACPILSHHFWSNNCLPDKSCLGYELRNITSLKQHLGRVHKIHLHFCPKCFEEFEQQPSCDKHIREATCLPSDPEVTMVANKIKPAILTKIKKRGPNLNQEEQWFNIFRTLFPGQEIPWSAYIADQISQKPLLHMVDLFTPLDPELVARMLQELRKNCASGQVLAERTRNIVCEALQIASRPKPEERTVESSLIDHRAASTAFQGHLSRVFSVPNTDIGNDTEAMAIDHDMRVHDAGLTPLDLPPWTSVEEHNVGHTIPPTRFHTDAYAPLLRLSQQADPVYDEPRYWGHTVTEAINQAPQTLFQAPVSSCQTDSSSQNTVTARCWPPRPERKDSISRFSSHSSTSDFYPSASSSDDSWTTG